jgi:hypothetical protein
VKTSGATRDVQEIEKYKSRRVPKHSESRSSLILFADKGKIAKYALHKEGEWFFLFRQFNRETQWQEIWLERTFPGTPVESAPKEPDGLYQDLYLELTRRWTERRPPADIKPEYWVEWEVHQRRQERAQRPKEQERHQEEFIAKATKEFLRRQPGLRPSLRSRETEVVCRSDEAQGTSRNWKSIASEESERPSWKVSKTGRANSSESGTSSTERMPEGGRRKTV